VSDLAKANQDVCLSSCSELAQAISSLVADVEQSSRFGDDQLKRLKQRLVEFKSTLDLLIGEGLHSTPAFPAIDSQLEAVADKPAADSGDADQKQIIEDLKIQVSEKVDQLEKVRKEKVEAQQESESAFFQLHRAQEHLENYIVLTSEQSKMLDASKALHARAIALLLNSGRRI